MEKKITLLNLAIPIFLELLLFTLLGFVDTYMLSRVSDQAAGSVGVTNQIMMAINVLFNVITVGTGVLASQYIGAKRSEDAHKTIIVSFFAISIIGGISSLILIFFGQDLLIRMGVTEGLIDNASTYIQIVGGFMFVQSLLNIATVTIRTYGHAKEALKITALMNILNVILDALLIFGLFGLPKLGVAGVAIATSFSRTVAMIIALIYIFKMIIPISAIKYLYHFPREIFQKLLKIGVPSGLENFSYHLSQLVGTSIILYNLGESSFIARTYAYSIVSVCLMFVVAVGQANQLLIARLVGEERFDDAYKEAFKNFKAIIGISLILSLTLILFRTQLIGLFTDDSEIIKLASLALLVNAFLEPGRALNYTFLTGLKASGDTIFPVIIGVIFMWSVAVAGGYFLGITLGLGLAGMWIGYTIDEWIRGFIMLHRWNSKAWTKKSLV